MDEFQWITVNESLISYKRTYKNNSILVILNNTKNEVKFTLPKEFSRAKVLFATTPDKTTIGPYGFNILKV